MDIEYTEFSKNAQYDNDWLKTEGNATIQMVQFFREKYDGLPIFRQILSINGTRTHDRAIAPYTVSPLG